MTAGRNGERGSEAAFHRRYRRVRQRLFEAVRAGDPRGAPTALVRRAQTVLDRIVFTFVCEDMGRRIGFPPELIRGYLEDRARDPLYDPGGGEIWAFFKRLFEAMNTGGSVGPVTLPRIDGGLFAADPEIEALDLPNGLFLARGPDGGAAGSAADRNTLLSLRAGSGSSGGLGLGVLGRIFEQSIADPAHGEAPPDVEWRAAPRARKRDGVYYTPDWVADLLVEQALGPWFSAARAACGWPGDNRVPPGRGALSAYEARLRTLRVIDPACGAGVFLISALRRLRDERLAVERWKSAPGDGPAPGGVEQAALTAEILANNLYGVDVDPAAVEVAKLTLWLHAAPQMASPSCLDHALCCGDSLTDTAIGSAAIDWKARFPEVWPPDGDGGFDIVLGNPPYVKLQTLRMADPGAAARRQADRGEGAYESARTGNFDLYLLFIEQGLRLLAPGGRMAYIAPSLWTVNRHGEGLRRLVRRGRQLERWIDFGARQIFDGASTYTALQVFTREPQASVRVAAAPQGETLDVDWSDPALCLPYEALPEAGAWLMATGAQRALIDRLAGACLRLDDPTLTQGVIVGLQTSADAVYHLERLGPGRYRCAPKGAAAYEVALEDAIMKPLVSGAEAKRYEAAQTRIHLLFPYDRTGAGAMRLIPGPELERRFPKAWAYLRSWEGLLRDRERGAFDDDAWWRFGRRQNIDKQDRPKLIVPRLVEHLKASLDADGALYLDNVDVGGVIAAAPVEAEFLLAVINGPVADFVFRRIAKPFRGDYRSANKQFIAPLPVPRASPKEQAAVAELARTLQGQWTRRRALIAAAADRLAGLPRDRHAEDWLGPDPPSRTEALQARLDASTPLEAEFRDGALSMVADGEAVLGPPRLDDDAGRLAQAYWRWLLLSQAWRDANKLSAALRRPPAVSAATAAFIADVAALAGATDAIAAGEHALNARLYALYGLTDGERRLVEGRC